MGTKHKHAEVIKAWADGAEIQARPTSISAWADTDNPLFLESFEYRVKPKNIVVMREVRYDLLTKCVYDFGCPSSANIEYTFTPEGKLISAKVL